MDIRLPLPAALRQRVPREEYLWAHAISLIVSPPLVWAIWVYAVTLPEAENFAAALLFSSLFAFSICAAPMLFIGYKVRKGKISDMHMRLSRERYIPYSIAIGLGTLSEIIFIRFDADPVLILVMLVSIVELTLMLLGTFLNHISLHAMAMSSIISATALMFGFKQGLYFLPLLLLVISARLVLKRHTPVQIMAGTLIGALTPLGVVAALGFYI